MTSVRQESNVFTLARKRAGDGRASLRLPASRLYRARVELLERDDVLATLVEARSAAVRGDGRVVLVSSAN